MITRGAPEPASAPSSPSSRAPAAPSDSDAPTGEADVVDVTGCEEPWETASARRTSDPPPLRASKRAPTASSKAAAGETPAEARKGKKKPGKRAAAAAGGGPAPKKNTRELGSDSEEETKRPTPASKKAVVAVSSAPVETPPLLPPAKADRGFNLETFMASFEPGTASSGPAPGVATPPGIISVESSVPDGQLKPDVLSELRLLKEEVLRLRGMVGRPSPRVEYAATPSGLTAPNAKGELPPSELRYLTSSTFPEGSKKGKGDYNPPQAHLLAAHVARALKISRRHMFRPPDGASASRNTPSPIAYTGRRRGIKR
ncbi:hypothetical protein PF010_g28262 [Phytophthora fragariae]|uniref:Uncharacterized protein n=2 Tax=Phytophthora fragariae TaxID=53985 RepID=A0A6G0JRM6_9STRA|nr:hypothetical protein PF010_g28262 [Phytophthora fragariae]